MTWENGKLSNAKIYSKLGNNCRIRVKNPVEVFSNGEKTRATILDNNIIEFTTEVNSIYEIKSTG